LLAKVGVTDNRTKIDNIIIFFMFLILRTQNYNIIWNIPNFFKNIGIY